MSAFKFTPVRGAFCAWSAYRNWLNGPETDGMRCSEYDELVAVSTRQAEDLLSVPSQCPEDFILKVIASTDWGSGGMPDAREMPDLWAEAYRFAVEAANGHA